MESLSTEKRSLSGDIQQWLRENDFNDLLTLIDSPDNKDAKRAFSLTGEAADDGGTSFGLTHRDLTDVPHSVLGKYYVSDLPAHLTSEAEPKKRDIHIIVSIGSGARAADKFFYSVLQPLLGVLGLQASAYNVLQTNSPDSVAEYAQSIIFPQANAGLSQTILLLSGDGGIFDLINVALRKSRGSDYVAPVVGLFPFGTGNALASSSGLNDSTKGILPFLKGSPRPLPTFAATFSPGSKYVIDEGKSTADIPVDTEGDPVVYGGIVCSWGLHASLVADSDTEEYRKFGQERFVMAAKELLAPSDGSTPHTYRGKISTINPNRALGVLKMSLKAEDANEHQYVLVTMVSNLEKSLTISPDNKPLDGQLHILEWAPMSGEEVMALMGGAYAGGKHVQDSRVLYRPVEGVRIDLHEDEDKWRRICVDGKIVLVNPGGWVEVKKEPRSSIDLVA